MKRRRLAALLGACLVSATLGLAPSAASAWWINQPRFEKQVVTEGDPDDPGIAAPAPVPQSESEETTFELLLDTMVIIIDALGG